MKNKILNLIKQFPNDADLGAEIREMFKNETFSYTCCDKEENHDSNFYRTEVFCKVCGKVLKLL